MSIERRFSSERYDGSGVEDFSRSLTRWIDWIGRISGKDGGWRDMVGFSSFLEISERDSRLVSSLIWLILKRLSKYSFVFIKGGEGVRVGVLAFRLSMRFEGCFFCFISDFIWFLYCRQADVLFDRFLEKN